jgi:hypothetical protein
MRMGMINLQGCVIRKVQQKQIRKFNLLDLRAFHKYGGFTICAPNLFCNLRFCNL